MHVAKTYEELIDEAKEAELDKDLDKAAKIYERAIRQEPLEQFPYDRLMIVYRKQKQYEDELKVIEKGIKIFGDLYKKRTQKTLSKRKNAQRLSNQLIKSLGLKDKYGEAIYQPEPIASWLKRKHVVEKKMDK
jgi:tetratricopeptide (TPR) repeat protein